MAWGRVKRLPIIILIGNVSLLRLRYPDCRLNAIFTTMNISDISVNSFRSLNTIRHFLLTAFIATLTTFAAAPSARTQTITTATVDVGSGGGRRVSAPRRPSSMATRRWPTLTQTTGA